MAFDRYPILYESYAKGPEMSVTAKKMPTKLATTLGRTVDTTWESLEGKEVPMGTVVEIAGTLYWVDAAGVQSKVEGGKTINISHKVGTGAYSVIKTLTTDANSNFKTTYTLGETGIHTFQCEFPGDDKYEGCAQRTFSRIKAR